MVPSLNFEENGTPFIQLGVHKLELDNEELEGEYLERAKRDLRETPEVREEATAALRKLLESEEDLLIPKDDDDFLLKFLRPCKFYPNSAFKLMKKFYRFKTKYPKYSENLLPSYLKPAVNEGVATFMPLRDKTGCRIMVVQIGSKWNPKTLKLQDMFRAIMMFIEIAMAEPKTQVAGAQVIFDMNGLSMTHVYQFGPTFAKVLLEWVQECIPLRLKGIHIVNEPRIFNILFSIFKPFINEKLRRRINFHGSTTDKLIESFGAESLIPCYGGSLDIPEIPGQLLAELLCHYESEFKKASSVGYAKEKVINNND